MDNGQWTIDNLFLYSIVHCPLSKKKTILSSNEKIVFDVLISV